MTVSDELQGFITLQQLLDARAALRHERDTPPDRLAQLRETLSGRTASLGERIQRRDDLSAEQATLQGEVEALREERDHFRKQKSRVTNMKQLSAVVSELDFVETQLKAKEDRLLEIWQELEGLGEEIAKLGAETPEEREDREAAEKAWEQRRAELTVELQRVEDELRATQRHLGNGAMATFKKLWASRKPSAVVPLDGTSCSACHAELRPSLVQQVRALETLGYCDTCRRLLYDPEKLP